MELGNAREEFLAFALDLWRADTPAEVTALFKLRATRFGFPVFAFGELDSVNPLQSVMHLAEWPAEWFQLYVADGFFQDDPLVDFVGRGHAPFTWTERKQAGGLTRAHLRGFEAARDFGWRGGLAISLPRGGARFGMLSLAGPDDDCLSAEARAALSSMAVLAYDRARGLASVHGLRPVYPARLTQRELDCLSFVAGGASDQAIASKLGISASTAHEHVEAAKRKLRAGTRAQAVAIAVALGLISP